jgi:flagellar biosynthesis GTPase FlhF
MEKRMLPSWLSKFGWIILSIVTFGATAYWKGKKSAEAEIDRLKHENDKARAEAKYQEDKRLEELARARKRIREAELVAKQRDRKLERLINPKTQEAKDYLEQEIPEELRGFDE